MEDRRKYAAFPAYEGIMFYYFKKGKNTTETQQKICAACEDAVTDQMSRPIKLLGKMKKCVLNFTEKTKRTFWAMLHGLVKPSPRAKARAKTLGRDGRASALTAPPVSCALWASFFAL